MAGRVGAVGPFICMLISIIFVKRNSLETSDSYTQVDVCTSLIWSTAVWHTPVIDLMCM